MAEEKKRTINLFCPSLSKLVPVVAWEDERIDLGHIARTFGIEPATLKLNGHFISRGVDLIASSVTWKSLLSFFSARGFSTGASHSDALTVDGKLSKLGTKNRIEKPERVQPEPTPELEDACEKLFKGDLVTGKPYACGGGCTGYPTRMRVDMEFAGFDPQAQSDDEAGALSEEMGRLILEPKDQLSHLNILLESAKVEIKDLEERENRLEEELKAEKAKLEEKKALTARLEGKAREQESRLTQLEEVLAQVEESTWEKEEAFPSEAAQWATDHHVRARGDNGFLPDHVQGAERKEDDNRYRFIWLPADRIVKPERVHPEPTPELEDACEKLLKGDPVTGKPYAYGGWVYRLPNLDGGTSTAHDAEDDRANSPDCHAEASSPHPDMNFSGFVNLDASDDEVLHSDQPPSPPQMSGMEGAITARCTPLHELIRDKKVKSPSATHLSEGDRADSPQIQVKAKSKETGASSSRAKAQKRKDSQKSSRRSKRKKTGSLDLEGESIEEAFLALAKRLHKTGAISEEVGRLLWEPRDHVSQLTLLHDSAKLEINDRAEREKKLEEERVAEKTKLEEERARYAWLEEDGQRKVAELEEVLAQVEEAARAKEQFFPVDAANWAACHHTEVARSILTTSEDTMDFFKVMYIEPEGKRMITHIGSYGYQCGKKAERSLLYGKIGKQREAPYLLHHGYHLLIALQSLSIHRWADRVIKPERVHLEPTKDLEVACEKLLKGDPVTGKPYAYGGWVFWLPNPDGGTFATHDAEDDRANFPDSHVRPALLIQVDMNFTRMSTLFEDDDDDVELHHVDQPPNNDQSTFSKLPSPPHIPETEGATSSQKEGLPQDFQGGQKKKKTGSLDLEGESIEETFLALAKKLSKAGVISEEVGQSLLEPKDQVSQLNLLLDSAKSEINDLVERERRQEVELELRTERAKLEEERALLEEERARSARLEEGKRKVAELEEALAQVEESARVKEECFPDDAANWAACHHTEIARSILTKPEDTMDFFKIMYKEPEGKRMITDIGSYGFQCGQKEERSLLYARLQKRDPSFDPAKIKLPALYKEEPSLPFPLE
ncbi:unnamed protein product [Cuscuta campestris]|uniref:Uncharacterized protein n=1 Tax=Cuscuta campestris TaxID=132261 RepID=A0A484NLJ7_9ASTE|nr:unnamed protein product [Cuscuta campestris]